MTELIKKLEYVKYRIIAMPFTPENSIQVDKLDLVIDYLKLLL